MFATRALRQGATHADRTPLIRFLGKRSIPSSIDHTPHVHPVSPTQKLPADFSSSAPKSASSFTSYRQQAQQHGPLGRNTKAEDGIGNHSGHSLGAVEASKGEYFDRNELPQRFRRSRIELSEIDAIETGGATLVC